MYTSGEVGHVRNFLRHPIRTTGNGINGVVNAIDTVRENMANIGMDSMEFGQGGVIRDLRGQFGKAYNNFAKDYNSQSATILKQAREAANAEGFSGNIESYLETDKGKIYNDELIQLRNQLLQDHDVEGIGNQLQNALDDYSSVNGRQFISKKDKEVMGILKNGDYKSTPTRTETIQGFEANIGGKNYEYINTIQKDVVEGFGGAPLGPSKTNVIHQRRAFTLDDKGNKIRGSLTTIEDADWDAFIGDTSISKTPLEFDAEGRIVSSGLTGVTSFSKDKVFVGKTRGDFGVPDPSVKSVKRAYSNLYDDSIQREASKIAKTGVGENSGIFKSIAAAAKANPVVAAAVAIGGFGIANKLLDRRREYD